MLWENRQSNYDKYPKIKIKEIDELSSFLGILFFMPFTNLIILAIAFWKLGTIFNTSVGYKIGLVLLPIVFYPLLASSDKKYKAIDEEVVIDIKYILDFMCRHIKSV